MPEAMATDLANQVREAALSHLWRQWQAIGATATTSRQATAIVDPEALILMSLWMLEHEQRLGDVARSWVKVNSSLVSIQRLRNLRPQFPKSVSGALAALAEVGVEEAKDSRWESLRKRGTSPLEARANKTRSLEARFGAWSTLLLQLRRGMGVGAKADTLTFLLGTSTQAEWSSVTTIAEAVGYTPAAIRRVADDLAAARFIRVPGASESDRGIQRLYQAAPGAWAPLLRVSVQDPGWGHWRERYLLLIALLTWLEELDRRSVSAYARDVEAREILGRHAAAFLRNQVVAAVDFDRADHGAQYLEDVAHRLLGWIENRG